MTTHHFRAWNFYIFKTFVASFDGVSQICSSKSSFAISLKVYTQSHCSYLKCNDNHTYFTIPGLNFTFLSKTLNMRGWNKQVQVYTNQVSSHINNFCYCFPTKSLQKWTWQLPNYITWPTNTKWKAGPYSAIKKYVFWLKSPMLSSQV